MAEFINAMMVKVRLGPAPVTVSGGPTSLASELNALADLHRQGDLSDTEYATAKRRLLDQI